MSREPLEDGCHAELALARKDLLLQLFMTVNPTLRQRPTPAVKASHPLEREIWRTGEELSDLLIVHPKALTYRLPCRFLARYRQRRVDPVERHPIYKLLPLRPVPPGQTVPEGAVVQKVTVLGPADFPEGVFNLGQLFRQVQLVTTPGDVAVTVMLQIPVQSHRHRHAGVTTDHDFAAARFEFENIAAVFGADDLKGKLVNVVGQQSLEQSPCRARRLGVSLALDRHPGRLGNDRDLVPRQRYGPTRQNRRDCYYCEQDVQLSSN